MNSKKKHGRGGHWQNLPRARLLHIPGGRNACGTGTKDSPGFEEVGMESDRLIVFVALTKRIYPWERKLFFARRLCDE